MDKPQVKKDEVSREIRRPPDENSQPRIQRVQQRKDKEKLQIMVQKWRAERQASLMSRLMKKTGHGGYSSALFGTVPASNQEKHAPILKKIKEKPPQKVPNFEERKSAVHAFAARPAIVTQGQLPSSTGLSSRLQHDQPGTSSAAKEIKETVPKKAPKFGGSKPNSVAVKGKLKPLVIRDTLASRLRKEKADPIIGLKIPSTSLKTANAESTLDPTKDKPGPSNVQHSRSTSVPAAHKVSLSRPEIPLKVMASNPQRIPVASHIVEKKSTLAGTSQKKETASLEKPKASLKKTVNDGITAKVSSRRSSIRRSVSSIGTYFDHLDMCDVQKYVIRSQSVPNIEDTDKQHSSVKFQGLPSPIREEEQSPREAPVTAPHCKKNETPVASTSGNCYTPKPEVLRPRMQMPSKVSSTSQENPATPVNLNEIMTLKSSSESCGETKMETEAMSPIQRSLLAAISLNETVMTSPPHCSSGLYVVKRAENEEKENANPKELFIPETLGDLYKLIQLGYPRDQCDEWLTLIRRTNKGVTNMPQYWECLAALERAHGDCNAAIDSYGRAVDSGEETAKIEAALEVLRDKFSALNVITKTPKITPSKERPLIPSKCSSLPP